VSFFENLLVLLLAAIVLLQLARRLSLPYPAMLAAAGVALALIPGSPEIMLSPRTSLALFIAPALVDAAFDFPLGAARRFWGPLFALAVVAVLATTAVVAWIGWAYIGLPIAAAVALGAIVAPPDAAAASAVLSSVSVPRSIDVVLKGESLFNDATALLVFSAAVTIQEQAHFDLATGLRLLLAVPGGLLLGVLSARLMRKTNRFVQDTLGGNLLQFVNSYLIWIVAERLRLSAVLCVIAFAMTAARTAELTNSARMRVQSYAVWSAVVFTLNVFAFLLMGMQARSILQRMPAERLHYALGFIALVVLAIIVVRLAVVVCFHLLTRKRSSPDGLRHSLLVGWSGMRGFVTLATSFALPSSFPHRDIVVLTAFCVVLATLVVQGLTLAPVIRMLKLHDDNLIRDEIRNAKLALATAALKQLNGKKGSEAENLRYFYTLRKESIEDPSKCRFVERYRSLGLAAIKNERLELERLRSGDQLGATDYLMLQEDLDWNELTLLADNQRRIEES
jgi:monovalent cation/hydrogen antiporter